MSTKKPQPTRDPDTPETLAADPLGSVDLMQALIHRLARFVSHHHDHDAEPQRYRDFSRMTQDIFGGVR